MILPFSATISPHLLSRASIVISGDDGAVSDSRSGSNEKSSFLGLSNVSNRKPPIEEIHRKQRHARKSKNPSE